MRNRCRIAAFALAGLAWASAGAAQQPAATTRPAPGAANLPEEQKLIRDRMSRLEDKMFELSQALAKSDPKQAGRLTDAYREARQRVVRNRMDEIAKLLQAGRLSDAGDKQKELTGDLEYLLKMLTEENGDFDARQREIEKLERMRQQLEKIIQEQDHEKQRAEQAARLQARLQQLRKAIGRTAELAQRQDKAAMRKADKASEPRSEGQAAAKEQGGIRADARKLAEELKSPPGEPSAETAEAKGGEPKAGRQPPRDSSGKSSRQSAEQSSTQASGKPTESKEQASDSKGKDSAGTPSGKSESEKREQSGPPQVHGTLTPPGLPKPEEQPSAEDAPGELNRAADKMQKAEQSLDQGARGEATPEQEAAAKHLRNALQRLQKEADALEKQMDLDRQAREQKQTTDKTRQLGEEAGGQKADEKSSKDGSPQGKQPGDKQQDPGDPNKQAAPQKPGDSQKQQGGQQQDGQQQESQQQSGRPQEGEQQDGQPSGEQKQGQPKQGDDQQQQKKRAQDPQNQQPGQQGLEEAVPHQEEAEKNLDKRDPKKAAEQQEKALQKLQQAQEDLQDALEQLRREQQEEMLTALETRFNAMLARQLDINRTTDRLDAAGRANWTRADQLDLATAAENQAWVAESAAKAAQILKDEGTTIVFADLVAGLHDDAQSVAQRLTGADTGAAVRLLQSDIVETLKEMVDAVKKKKEENEKEKNGQNEGGDDKKGLLPGSAELKLLRSCQLRVNHSTQVLEEQRALPQTDMTKLDGDVARTAKRQSEVARLARALQEAKAADADEQEKDAP